MAVRDVLLHVADGIEKELRLIAKSWKDNDQYDRERSRDKTLYDGLNCAIGVLQREWERNGFAGTVLAIMPPTDGYDENGDERQGVADYAALIEQDLAY